MTPKKSDKSPEGGQPQTGAAEQAFAGAAVPDFSQAMAGLLNGLFIDPSALAQGLRLLVSTVLESKRDNHLGAGPYERAESRSGMRNGYKPRTMNTRVGKLTFQVPQVRDCPEPFHHGLFERYQRSEKALLVTLQEMYVKGVSTRDVADVMQKMGGYHLSPQAVSRAAAELDEAVKHWRERRLDSAAYPYVLVDARFEKVRVAGHVVSMAAMVVVGVNAQGVREVLGMYTGDTESEETWSEVFRDLKARGLKGVRLLVSDAHLGIRRAASKHLQAVPWQRCRVHYMRELLAKVPFKQRGELGADLKAAYASGEAGQCMLAAAELAAKWEPRCAKVARALREGFEDTLTVARMDLPEEHRRKLHSTNMVERLNRELKRRSRVASIFPNDASMVRLLGSVLMETDEKWRSQSRLYLNMSLAGD